MLMLLLMLAGHNDQTETIFFFFYFYFPIPHPSHAQNCILKPGDLQKQRSISVLPCTRCQTSGQSSKAAPIGRLLVAQITARPKPDAGSSCPPPHVLLIRPSHHQHGYTKLPSPVVAPLLHQPCKQALAAAALQSRQPCQPSQGDRYSTSLLQHPAQSWRTCSPAITLTCGLLASQRSSWWMSMSAACS